jgi:hypothetical protein
VDWDGWEAMVWLSWWLDASILAQKSEFVQLNFLQTSSPKPDWCKTYSSWIPILTTTQNHPWGVSSELGWFRSNGLALMMVGCINSGSKIRICQLNFPQTSAPKPDCNARLRAHGSQSWPSKIIHGVYQVNWDGWEATVWLSWGWMSPFWLKN